MAENDQVELTPRQKAEEDGRRADVVFRASGGAAQAADQFVARHRRGDDRWPAGFEAVHQLHHASPCCTRSRRIIWTSISTTRTPPATSACTSIWGCTWASRSRCRTCSIRCGCSLRRGFTSTNERAAAGFIVSSMFLFLCGVAFGYFILLPQMLTFLVAFANDGPIKPLISINEYFDLILIVLIGSGSHFRTCRC